MNLRFIEKGIVIFAIIAGTILVLVSCSKNDNDEPVVLPTTRVETPEHLKDWTSQPKVDSAQPYMAFATDATATTTLSLTAMGSTATATDVWVDTNNNGVFDEGVDKRITDFTTPISFTATSGVFTVYGKVKELTANGNSLTAADVRKNEALTKLNVADNQLSEKALLNLVNSLPATTASGTTAVVLRKAEGDSNSVTDAVRKAVTDKGWQALKTEKGKEVPDLPADTEAPKVGAITEVTVTELYSLNLKWTAATDNKTPLEDLRYQVFWKAEGSTEVQNSGKPKAAMFNYKIDILAQNTSYTVWVEVLDNAHNKAKYPEKTFTTDGAYIELTTNKKVGEKVELYVGADDADRAGVWLDLNNNNKWDEGTDLKPTDFNKTIEFPLQTQTFRIYGKIYYLKCNEEELKAIDIHNTVLTDLNVKNNLIPSIPSIAHLKHLKELDIDTHTLHASSVPKGLTHLYLNETIPLATIDISLFTELIVLNVEYCKSLKRLDLRNNKKLISLYADNSGLTELDLSQQPELTDLDLGGTPLTKLNIAGNKTLKTVFIELTKDGRGLQGTALMDFIKQLPTREEGKKGRIFLSRTQATMEVKSLLASKYWEMIVRL